MGRKPIGKRAMTPAESMRRYRAKKRRKRIWGLNPDSCARRPTPRREDLDFWPTPPCLAHALAEHVLPHLPPDVSIWESAAGDGVLIDALVSSGRRIIATDVNPQRQDIRCLDFLHDEPPVEAHGAAIVTNPPFGTLGDKFRARALELLDAGTVGAVALLQRVDAGGAKSRAADFNRAAFEFTCVWRPIWLPGTKVGGRWWFQWFIWLEGVTGPPVNIRLTRGLAPVRAADHRTRRERHASER
jgi:hypothetical protein